jgi:GH18 family chitinase
MILLLLYVVFQFSAMAETEPDLKVVAFLTSASLYRDLQWNDIYANRITHIKYAFMNILPDDNGNTYNAVLGDPWMDRQHVFADTP